LKSRHDSGYKILELQSSYQRQRTIPERRLPGLQDLTKAPMPICIECRHPVKTLWTQYSGAGDKSSGHNIRLTVCKNCGSFCDKYVEHDKVVLFIDLVLIKPQVGLREILGFVTKHEVDRFRLCLGLPAFAAQYIDEG
jgi:hypothetical protein